MAIQEVLKPNAMESATRIIDGRTPVADRIRERILKAGERFHANDNISDHIEEGGVMPNEHSALIGLSKYARLVEWVMTRPQIQEEAIAQLAELLQNKMQPDGLAIVMEADHCCMQWRGVRDMDSKMTNSIMRGSFLKNPDLRREFLSLLAGRNK